MSQPPYPSADGTGTPWTPPSSPAATSSGWPQPAPHGGEWEVRTPSWQPGPLPPPTQPAPAAPGAAKPARTALLLVGLAALLGTLIGAVGAALLVATVVVDGAEIGSDMADEIESAVRDGVIEGNEEALEQSMEEFGGMFGMPGMSGVPGEDVEQFPPVPPESLGLDPVLDGYAQQCFAGDLQACDDLMYESPPMSAYEEYATTCGGRVKAFAVYSCTELE